MSCPKSEDHGNHGKLYHRTRVACTSKYTYSPGTSLRMFWTRRICCRGPYPYGRGPGFPSSRPVTYASEGGIKTRRTPPSFIPRTASSSPWIAVPSPTVNMKGTLSWVADESTKYPLLFLNTHCKFTLDPCLTVSPAPGRRSA
jgi:hypothetical protein